MTVNVVVEIKAVKHGEYTFHHQLAREPEAQNGSDGAPEPGRMVPQTSSVLAPGLARRLPV